MRPSASSTPSSLPIGVLNWLPHARVGAGVARERFRPAHRRSRQRDRTAGGEAVHQHHPALAGIVGAADDPVDRHEHVLAPVRAVLEHRVQRQVAAADVHAGRAGGDQRAGDAQVVLVAQQLVRVVEPERESEQRGDGAQRDVALVPREAHAEHFLALPDALADHAVVRDRGGVRTGLGRGERKARDFLAPREARQVVVLLRIGAVMQQQFRRSERVRHHHRDRERVRARRELHHHRGMRERREAEAAVLLRDDHAEEALVLEVLPHRLRQVVALVGDLPVVGHRADFVHRAVEERLFLRRELRLGDGEQLVPVGFAGEQVAVPPHRAGVDRFALGLRHVRKDAAEDAEHRVAERQPAQRRHVGDERGDAESDTERPTGAGAEGGEFRQPGEQRAAGDGPRKDRGAEESEDQERGEAGEDEGEHGNLLCRSPRLRIRRLS